MERPIYRLRADGRDLVVEVWHERHRNHARLLVDGEPAATAETRRIGDVELRAEDGPRVRVGWWWTGRVSRVALVEGKGGAALTPFIPPPGTRAARLHEFQRRNPGLYAARHVVTKLGGMLFGVLGIGALLDALLPEIDPPDWLRYLNPFFYLEPVFRWIGAVLDPVFAWIASWWPLPDLGEWPHYVIGFLVACLLARQEYHRRSKRAAEQHAARHDRSGQEGTDQDAGEQHGPQSHGADRGGTGQCGTARGGTDQRGTDQHAAEHHAADQHAVDQHGTGESSPDRARGDRESTADASRDPGEPRAATAGTETRSGEPEVPSTDPEAQPTDSALGGDCRARGR